MNIVNYEISFKTIQKYCKHRIDGELFKYNCTNIKHKWSRGLRLEFDSRCTQANCPLVKRLWTKIVTLR